MDFRTTPKARLVAVLAALCLGAWAPAALAQDPTTTGGDPTATDVKPPPPPDSQPCDCPIKPQPPADDPGTGDSSSDPQVIYYATGGAPQETDAAGHEQHQKHEKHKKKKKKKSKKHKKH
jgi:hypothetical protein